MSRVTFLTVGLMVGLLIEGTVAQARSRVHAFDPLDDETPAAQAKNPFDAFARFAFSQPVRDAADDVVTGSYDQLLNPADPSDKRTFKQRYYLYSPHAEGEDSPVIYYICGEAECMPRSFLGRFAEDVATAIGAHIVALEHRYYGQSVPFDILTADTLQYLTTQNALSDLVRFQSFATEQHSLRGKWLAMGGSYPGSLAAFYRLKHPDLVVGALASSAPVQAKNNFEEYDGHVTQVVGPECAESLRQVVRASEQAIAKGQFAAFKARFGGQDVIDNRDFLYMLADVTADAVQYGYPQKLCGALTVADDAVAAYAEYTKDFLKGRQQTAVEFSPQGSTSTGAQDSGGMRQWYYQSCREYGYWQDAHSDPSKSVRSPRLNAEYDRDYCRRLFGITELAREADLNDVYYAELLKPEAASHILYTNGSDDPWSELSINSVRGNNTNPNTPSLMIQGKAHCSDLRAKADTDPQSLRDARAQFTRLAREWTR